MLQKTSFLFFIIFIGITTLTSCKKNQDINTSNKVSGNTDVINVLDNVGFVSNNPDYNTLYGNRAVNDLLLEIDERVVGDKIKKLTLIIKKTNKSDTLNLTAIGSSPKPIKVQKYIRHFQVEIPQLENANDVSAEIHAYNEENKRLAKVHFSVTTRSNKPAGIQPLQFPTSGFYDVENNYLPYENNTYPFIGDKDREGSDHDKYFVAVRAYGGGTSLKGLIPFITVLREDNNYSPIYSETHLIDVQGSDKSSAFVFFLDDDNDNATKDASFEVDRNDHFIDHDKNKATARIAIYQVKWSGLFPYFEFRITED